MINVEKLYLNSSKLIFLIYLPITFLVWYSMLDGSGGGITSILIIAVSLFFLGFIKYQKIDINFSLFLFFITYCFLYIVIYYSFLGDLIDGSNRSLFFYHLVGILMYVVSYIVGRNFVKQNEHLLVFIFFLMFIKILSNADLTVFRMNLDSADDNLKGLYLGLSDVFCIFALILIGLVKKQKLKMLLFLFSVVALFILNSRSSLYIFIFSTLLYFFLFLKIRNTIIFLTLLFLFAVFYSSKFMVLFTENNRMFSILSFNGSDQSSQERLALGEQGLNQIANNIILGDYGGVIKLHGELGAYIHNILSYWQNYGVLAFMLCLYFFIYQPIKASSIVYKLRWNIGYHHIFLLCIYLFLTMLFTRSYAWYYAWFVLGLIHNFLNMKFKKL